GGMARWHAPVTNTISSAAQSLDRNGNSSRRCIVEPTSRPIALLLFSTGIVGNRAFRNARAARGPARVDVGGEDTGMVERPPAIRKPGARRTCHATWRTRAALAACSLVAAAGCAAPPAPPGHGPPDAVALDAPRTAFVQLFEWKWTDIARECETYLGP